MPDTDYPIKDLPFGVTKLIVYFFVSLKEILTETCKGKNPFKLPFPAAVTHPTQFEPNPNPTPTLAYAGILALLSGFQNKKIIIIT